MQLLLRRVFSGLSDLKMFFKKLSLSSTFFSLFPPCERKSFVLGEWAAKCVYVCVCVTARSTLCALPHSLRVQRGSDRAPPGASRSSHLSAQPRHAHTHFLAFSFLFRMRPHFGTDKGGFNTHTRAQFGGRPDSLKHTRKGKWHACFLIPALLVFEWD